MTVLYEWSLSDSLIYGVAIRKTEMTWSFMSAHCSLLILIINTSTNLTFLMYLSQTLLGTAPVDVSVCVSVCTST